MEYLVIIFSDTPLAELESIPFDEMPLKQELADGVIQSGVFQDGQDFKDRTDIYVFPTDSPEAKAIGAGEKEIAIGTYIDNQPTLIVHLKYPSTRNISSSFRNIRDSISQHGSDLGLEGYTIIEGSDAGFTLGINPIGIDNPVKIPEFIDRILRKGKDLFIIAAIILGIQLLDQ